MDELLRGPTTIPTIAFVLGLSYLACLCQISLRSQFVLRAALKEAEHIEASQTNFALNGDQFDAFMEALDSPPTPNKALNKLLHTAAPWD